MRKTTLVIIIYVIGVIFCALVLGIWDAETNITKASIALVWTIVFLITLFYVDKNEQK
jgi:formate hydrogenlyase subunit 4